MGSLYENLTRIKVIKMLVMMMVGDAGGDWYGEVHGTLFCPSDGKRDTHRPIVCSGTTKPRLLPFFVTRASVERAQNRCVPWSCSQTQLSFIWATLAGDVTSASHRMERGAFSDRACDTLHASPSKPPSEGKWSLDSIVPAPAVAPNAAIRGKLGTVSEQTAGKSQNFKRGGRKGEVEGSRSAGTLREHRAGASLH